MDVLWIVAMVMSVALCLWGINLPYVGIDNANNNFLALASKNYLRFGYTALHFLPTYYVGQTLPEVVPYYLHHPVLFFLFASIPFKLFGTANWVVHASLFIFVLLSWYALYRLVKEVSTQEIARWTVVFAASMPWMSFFWKYIFFEQSSLFFTLLTLYFCVRYWKSNAAGWLWAVGASALLGGATDWYGGYLVFGFLYLLLARTGKRIWLAFVAYGVGEALGLGSYVAILYFTGHLGAAWDGYSARGLTHELTALSYWPARLALMTALRVIIYGSPIALVAWWSWIRNRVSSLLWHIGAVLFIIGLVNAVVMPVTTWGLSYFLYYLIPFIALLCGVWVAEYTKTSVTAVCMIIAIQLLWSTGIDGLKMMQMTKQTWKYEFGLDVSSIVPRYSRVGVLGYPGDVMQNYFFIDVVAFTSQAMTDWVNQRTPKDIRYVLVTCKGTCTPEELAYMDHLKTMMRVQAYTYKQNTGWLIDGGELPPRGDLLLPTLKPADVSVKVAQPAGVLRLYRYLRDLLGGTQI